MFTVFSSLSIVSELSKSNQEIVDLYSCTISLWTTVLFYHPVCKSEGNWGNVKKCVLFSNKIEFWSDIISECFITRKILPKS